MVARLLLCLLCVFACVELSSARHHSAHNARLRHSSRQWRLEEEEEAPNTNHVIASIVDELTCVLQKNGMMPHKLFETNAKYQYFSGASCELESSELAGTGMTSWSEADFFDTQMRIREVLLDQVMYEMSRQADVGNCPGPSEKDEVTYSQCYSTLEEFARSVLLGLDTAMGVGAEIEYASEDESDMDNRPVNEDQELVACWQNTMLARAIRSSKPFFSAFADLDGPCDQTAASMISGEGGILFTARDSLLQAWVQSDYGAAVDGLLPVWEKRMKEAFPPMMVLPMKPYLQAKDVNPANLQCPKDWEREGVKINGQWISDASPVPDPVPIYNRFVNALARANPNYAATFVPVEGVSMYGCACRTSLIDIDNHVQVWAKDFAASSLVTGRFNPLMPLMGFAGRMPPKQTSIRTAGKNQSKAIVKMVHLAQPTFFSGARMGLAFLTEIKTKFSNYGQHLRSSRVTVRLIPVPRE